MFLFFFFFQAEDGIRDYKVTGVQTCALPIAEVLVLEGHEDFEREFRGEVLQPSTAHLLDELGLLEYVRAQPHSLLEAGRIRADGREVGEFVFARIAPR